MTDSLQLMLQVACDRERRLEHELSEQRKEIRTLQNALASALANNCDSDLDDDSDWGEDDVSEHEHDVYSAPHGSDGLNEQGEPRALPEAILDSDGSVFRCSRCTWEVVDEVCQGCYIRHSIPEIPGEVDVDKSYRIIAMEHEALNSDRQLAPRGDTPTRALTPIHSHEDVPRSFRGGRYEYHALLSRGATREMCELFEMEFGYECGIVAWATEDIYKEFAGPAINDGDYWKIYLGRRIELEEGDSNGLRFVQSLLEEVVFYPLVTPQRFCRHGEQWETIQEEPGVWATRPSVEHAKRVERLLESEEVDPEQACEYARQALELNVKECDEMLDEDFRRKCSDLYPLRDRYDSSSDAEMEDEPQSGVDWPRHGWDTVWNSDEANDEHGRDSEDDETGDDIDDIDDDSDDNVDELFSGDELVLEGARVQNLEAGPSREEW